MRGELDSSPCPPKVRSGEAGVEFEGNNGTELVSVGKESISGLGGV
jgi:hypothetical protein